MTGTSISTPTTVASAAPELNPKIIVAVAIATSKWLLAPIIADGAASSVPRFRDRDGCPENVILQGHKTYIIVHPILLLECMRKPTSKRLCLFYR